MNMYYAKGIIPLTKIFGRGLHSQEPKGGFVIISHPITLNKMVQLTKYFRTELGGCLYLQANAFCHLCRLNILHADRKVAGWPQGSLQRSHTTRWPRTMLTGEGFQHQPQAGGRGTALGCFEATKPLTQQHPNVSVPLPSLTLRHPDTGAHSTAAGCCEPQHRPPSTPLLGDGSGAALARATALAALQSPSPPSPDLPCKPAHSVPSQHPPVGIPRPYRHGGSWKRGAMETLLSLLLRRGRGDRQLQPPRPAAPGHQAVPPARATSPVPSGAGGRGDAKSTTATGTARTGQATVGAAASGTAGSAALLRSARNQPACLSTTY